jgi:hypothetical protein
MEDPKLKNIQSRYELYRWKDGTEPIFTGQYVQDVGYLLSVIRKLEREKEQAENRWTKLYLEAKTQMRVARPWH